jgi:hypothetical protein
MTLDYLIPKQLYLCQVPVAHTYNPGYSGNRDQEDLGSKPAWANRYGRPYHEKTHHKNRAGGV